MAGFSIFKKKIFKKYHSKLYGKGWKFLLINKKKPLYFFSYHKNNFFYKYRGIYLFLKFYLIKIFNKFYFYKKINLINDNKILIKQRN